MKDNTYLHVALDFIDENELRRTNIQLVDKLTQKAIGIADFVDGSIARCEVIDGIDKTDFFREAYKLKENSIPVRFDKRNMFCDEKGLIRINI